MLDNNPTIAVIMAVYKKDRPELLRKALKSIVEQTYPSKNVRIYLGIDGEISKDLETIIKSYTFFYTIKNKKNIGLGPTLNKLVNALENEEFVFRMDADDISMRNRFELQIKYLLENPKVDILGTALLEVNEKDERIGLRTYPNAGIREYIAKAAPVAHPTVCFRRRVFKIINYSSTIRLNEDIDLWFKALKNDFIFDNLPKVLYKYLINNSFYKRRSYDKSFSEFGVYIKGIWSLHRISLLYVFPVARLIFRLLPRCLVKSIYNSNLRKTLLNTMTIQ